MLPLNQKDSIAAFARLAQDHGATELCSAVWPSPPPAFVTTALRRSSSTDSTAYPDPRGEPVLRDAVARYYAGGAISAKHVTVAPGATGALLFTLSALADPGDEIVSPEPGYGLSSPLLEALGLRSKRVAAWCAPRDRDGWRLDLDLLLSAVTGRTRAILVTDPNNPTGSVLTRSEWGGLIAAAQRLGCLVIADRVYEHYPLDGEIVPTAELVADGVIVVSSFSKSFHAAGLRVGWVLAEPGLDETIASAACILTGGVAKPVQIAAADALLQMPRAHLAREAATARNLRSQLKQSLSCRGIDAWPADAGLFLNVPANALGADNSLDAWKKLLEIGVGGVPSTAFRTSREAPAEAFVRLSFARDTLTMGRLRHRLSLAGAPSPLKSALQRGEERDQRL